MADTSKPLSEFLQTGALVSGLPADDRLADSGADLSRGWAKACST